MDTNTEAVNNQIQQYKVKTLIRELEQARGNGTSMISLIIRPKDDIAKIAKMLNEEYGTASNIKSRVNRLSVLSAITSTTQKLKTYTHTPPNGLVIYCGTILLENGKEKKVNIDFEPFKPINSSLYLCDNKFHLDVLKELLEATDKFGFIIMDGNGCLYGLLQGSTRSVLHKFTIDLPKKHGRGGQSSVRFARLRLEKRHNYVRRVAEVAVQMFITNDKVNVTGLILAGSADFKTVLAESDLFDPRLAAKIVKIVDVSYGGENGFTQAIELSQSALTNIKLIQEKKVVEKFFEEVATDSCKYVYGIDETIRALNAGCVEQLILWENLKAERLVLKNLENHEIEIRFSKSPEALNRIIDEDTKQEFDVIEKQLLTDWLIENYENYGATLIFITDNSQEGSQFVKGFGGIGGILRYKINMDTAQVANSDDYDSDFM